MLNSRYLNLNKKIIKYQKVLFLTSLILISCLSNHSFAQQLNILDTRVPLKFENVPLRMALLQIAEQTNTPIIFSDDLVKNIRVNCECTTMSIKETLNHILQNTKISYVFHDGQIILTRKKQSLNSKSTLKGFVKNQSVGENIPDANIVIEGTTLGGVSDKNGHYVISKIPEGHYSVKAIMMGYESQEKEIHFAKGNTVTLDFQLKQIALKTREIVKTANGNQLFQSVGQVMTQLVPRTTDVFVGKISVLNLYGNQYGLRMRYWPSPWFSSGLEAAIAPGLNTEGSYSSQASSYSSTRYQNAYFTRLHLYSSIRLRFFKYIKPYFISSIGMDHSSYRQSEYDSYYDENGNWVIYEIDTSKKRVRKTVFGYTAKVGLASEIGRLQLLAEVGGGKLGGTGHYEGNISIGYALKPLPVPPSKPQFEITGGIQILNRITGPYFEEGRNDGFFFSLHFPSDKTVTREYNVGIFPDVSPTVNNFGINWRIKHKNRFLRPFSFAPGIQLLMWGEGVLLPAFSFKINANTNKLFHNQRLSLFGEIKSLATYSKSSGFISGYITKLGISISFDYLRLNLKIY